MIKRIISITLCAIIMCTGLLSVTASAAVTQNISIKAPIITTWFEDTKSITGKTYYEYDWDEKSFKLKLPANQNGTIYYWHSEMSKAKYIKYKGEKITLTEDGTIKFYTYYNKQRSTVKTLKVKFATRAVPVVPGTYDSIVLSGTYNSSFNIMLNGMRPGSKIYYTVDGTKATDKSTRYRRDSIITIDKDTTLSVIVYNPDYTCIRVTYKYKIDPNSKNEPYSRIG